MTGENKDFASLAAIEAIRQVKSRYFRGVDTSDGDLVRSILAADCELDYRGCCTDPVSGTDFMPAMNVVLKGRDTWVSDAFQKARIVSVHHGYNADITLTGADTANAVWAFTDRFYFPEGAPCSRFEGHGHYHDSYVRVDGIWLLKTTRITRLKVMMW